MSGHVPGAAPALVVEVELDSGEITGTAGIDRPYEYRWVWAVVLRGGIPVGDLCVPVPPASVSWETPVIVAAHRQYAGLAARTLACDETSKPLVSVIIATRGRPAQLRESVAGILSGSYPNVEVVIVDNSPRGDAAPTVGALRSADERVRYVWEPVPGISRARNEGAARANGEVLAFTDDDVLISRQWVSALVATLSSPPIPACVTGLIVPAELETSPQLWMWMASGLNKGYRRRVFDAHAADLPDLFPFRVGVYGSGANLAIRADAYRALGGFDEALGTGTRARGGEDLDLFLRLILAGQPLVYEPAAYLRHQDGRRFDDAIAQRAGYGTGLAAVLTKHLMSGSAGALVRLAPRALRYLLSPRSPKNAGKQAGYPRVLDLAELAGLAHGPLAYRRSRAQLAALRKARA